MKTKPKLELGRQIFHLCLGLLIIILFMVQILNPVILLAVLVLGLFISFICMQYKVPVFSALAKKYDRPSDPIPGKGIITYLAGITIASFIFQNEVLFASILILSFGDSFSNVFGRIFGQLKYPKSSRTVEGTIIGLVAAALAAMLFVNPIPAFLGALAAMLAEIIEIDFLHLDDNMIIPLVAGIVIQASFAF
ncbi:hypothetical protein JW868_00320 [Candidatus Woesearchaeota archaeon]|nr:hypothetical protein [Candidatus Woesearchaeota archaeon]